MAATAPDPAGIAAYAERAERAGFSGSVLVEHQGKVIFDGAFGLADDATATRNTTATVFDIGSITKQFTAAAIMRLVDQGRISPADPITRFLTNVPADKASITVDQLLSHTSGLTDHSDDDLERLDRSTALSRILASRLANAPGVGYRYSNSGYTVLAAIIEQVTGEPFLSYMRREIFDAQGLASTGFYGDPRWKRLPVAHGYMNGRDNGAPSTWPGPFWGPMGNGEALSTTGDLLRWHRALRKGLVVSLVSLKKMWSPHVNKGGEAYGYGWSVARSALGPVVTHNGGGMGGNSDIAWYPGKQLLIIVLSNRITYRTFLTEPLYLDVSLPATELRAGIVGAIATNDYTGSPRRTLPRWIPVAIAAAGLVLIGVAVWIVARLLRRRSSNITAEGQIA